MRQLEHRAQEARVLLDNLVASVVLRTVDGTIIHCSPYTEVLTGYSVQEICGSTGDFFENVMHPDDRAQYQRALKICQSGEAFQYRYRLYHRSGIEMWVETRTVPILDDSGTVTSSLSITLDVTGTVRYQRQVEEKNRDLQDFTYMVSHDLKAPIFTIKGMLGVIHDDFGKTLPDGMQEVLTHIERGTLRLEQLVSRVLEYSRISSQESRAETVSLREVFDDVARDFEVQLKDTAGTLQVEASLPMVVGDRVHVYRIFANLVGNALKYRAAERPPRIQVTAAQTRDGRFVKVHVTDNGLGIPADKLDSVFRPFHRLHGAVAEGTGIGLATVKKLTERMGGSVELRSEVDAGSTFSVTLRRQTDEQQR
jgi:PAS domain S-box-containing protein